MFQFVFCVIIIMIMMVRRTIHVSIRNVVWFLRGSCYDVVVLCVPCDVVYCAGVF